MTEQQLREIEERAGKPRQADDWDDWTALMCHASEDIPALVAEVRRLREAADWFCECAEFQEHVDHGHYQDTTTDGDLELLGIVDVARAALRRALGE